MDFLKPEYNILKVAGSLLGYKHGDEAKAKISAARKTNFGYKRSEETKAKISVSMMGNSNGRNQPNAVKIEVLDLETNITTSYDSIGAASRALNINLSSISMYFISNQYQYQKKPFKGRYIFVYKKID